MARAQVHERLLPRCREVVRLAIGIRSEYVVAQHHVRSLQESRWLELSAVHRDRVHHLRGCEMRGKRVGEAEQRCELGAKQAGTQDPDWHLLARAGYGAHRSTPLEMRDQFQYVVWERVRIGIEIATQGTRGGLIAAGRAS